MDFDDLIERVDEGVFSLLIPVGVLLGAGLGKWATKRFQQVSHQQACGASACGLTGQEAAQRLLTGCGLVEVAVVATAGRDLYHTSNREVQLNRTHYAGRSLAALATAAHEVGHAQQFAQKRRLHRLRLICRRCCQVLVVAALLLFLGAPVMPVRNLGSVLLVLIDLVVVLQAAVTLPHERDASRRAKELLRKEGLITPGEEAGFDRLLSAAWLTYAAAEAQRGLLLLMLAALTLVLASWPAPVLIPSEVSRVVLPLPRAGTSSAPILGTLSTAIRLIPLVVIGPILLKRYRSYQRSQPSPAERAAGHNNAAMAALSQGDFAAAARQFDVVITLLPPTAAAHFNRGCAFVRMGERDRALADFDRTLALDPALLEVRRVRGNLWLEKNDLDRALSDFDAAIQQAPTSAAAWRDRGLTFLWRGDYDRALSDLDEAIRLDSTDAVAFNNRGVVYMKRHERAQACADLREAIRLDPHLPNPRRHLAALDATCALETDNGSLRAPLS